MSRLSRSIVNSPKLDEDDDDRTDAAPNPKAEPDLDPDQSSPSHSHPSSDPNTPRGVKEDISELTKTLTRQFWGVASFLAPPPLGSSNQQLDHIENEQSLRPSSDGWDEASDEALIAGIRSDLSEIGGKFKTEISKLSKNIAVSEESEKYESGNVVGVTEDVVAFARDIAMHPRTWLDFPVPDNGDFDDFDMSDAQQEHALAIERLAPRLAALRIEICPGHMSEGCFWKIYFILLHPQLNLSTPQVVAAREMLMPGLQYRAKMKVVEDHSERDTSKITADLPREESLSLPCSSQSKAVLLKATGSEEGDTAIVVEIETEKHPVKSGEMQVVDKSVIEEEPTKVIKHQHSTSGSSGVSIEKFEDDADDWLEETSEAFGRSATTIPIRNDEDVSFSDLEDDDDDSVPISYKQVTSGSDSSTKDSRDWVQLGRSSTDSVKDVS
ncbi:BSD domain-containing protein [Gossypium australe]|uniref:BSD domain-containing protein n=1 Tax=Gossypium australe TaxID=47621 RepID=A0A5B6VYK3_9ROSI|nr:BSD domain-containing protein [Gossypium australe]